MADAAEKASVKAPATTMDALRVETFTGFERLRRSRVPVPVPGDSAALVRVGAVCLTRGDVAVMVDRAGGDGSPIIPGASFAGTVVQDRRFAAGTPVAVDPYIACGSCRACGLGRSCLRPIILGRQRDGGFAEFAVAPSQNLVPLSRHIPITHGAAIAASGAIASKVLFEDGAAQASERILVTGATGSLGLTVIQVARAAGCEVVALVTREDRVPIALQAGAHHAVSFRVDAQLPDPAEIGGEVDMILHLATGTGWLPSLFAALRPGGRLLFRRARPGAHLDLDLGRMSGQGLRLIASTGARSGGLADTINRLSSVPVPPVIEQVRPFAEFAPALQHLAERANRGAVVLELGR